LPTQDILDEKAFSWDQGEQIEFDKVEFAKSKECFCFNRQLMNNP
jgi:hypothetical protein